MHLVAAVMAFELAASGPLPAASPGNQVSPAALNAQAKAPGQGSSNDVDGREVPATSAPSPGSSDRTPEIAERIFFDEGAAEIKSTSLPALDAVAAEIKGHPDSFPIVALDGHAASNERGPMRLSLSRATSVRLALIARGVDGTRLLERVSGATGPLCEHSRDACLEQERRVEFAILHPSTPPEAAAGPKEKPAPEPAVESPKQPELLAQVTFARGSSVLAPAALPPLDLVAGFLKANPTSLEIAGFAAAGEHAASDLARARAEAVRAYLVACGVSAGGLIVRARGTEEPVCLERSRECRARNRRAELRFSDARP